MADEKNANTNANLLEKMVSSVAITIIVAVFTTLIGNYVLLKVGEEINAWQTSEIQRLDVRITRIELENYNKEDAEKDREAILRELDLIFREVQSLKSSTSP